MLRLRKESKTVYSARNPYFVRRIQKADGIDLFEFEGRFVRVKGKLKKIQKLGNGAKLFYLEHQQLKKGLAVFSSEKIRWRQEMDKIKKGDQLQIEGFVTLKKKMHGQINLYCAIRMDYKCKSEE